MTEADIKPYLKPLAGGQVYPYVVKLNTQGKPAVSPPWIVFSIVDDVYSDVMCGQAESAAALQIDVYSDTIDEARDIRNQAREALAPLTPVALTEANGYETDTALYRATLELQIWQ